MPVTWLHISDFHVKGGDAYDRDVVLKALVRSVAEYRAKGRVPDVIFATGDIAFSGKAREYALAERFFEDLLKAAQLPKERLWVIPGNHDVDREEGEGLARTLDSREKADRYFNPERPKPHLTQKMRAYLDWHNRYFEGIRAAPEDSTCGPVEAVTVNGVKLGILPINSALFCEGEDDHGKLWVGRRCLETAIGEVTALDAALHVVLMHHPLEWLHPVEGENIQASLEGLGHVLLRGHLHVTRIETVSSGDGELLRIAAGAAYDTRKWPMRAMYGTLDGDAVTIFPIRYEDSPTEKWTIDPSAFPEGGEKSFRVGRSGAKTGATGTQPAASVAVAAKFKSNISARGNFPFVGREGLLAELDRLLNDPRHEGVVVLHGLAGTGKTAAAREFCRQHSDRYPGGTFLVDASKDAMAINLAQIGKVYLDLQFGPGLNLDEQGMQTFLALGNSRALLIYDNVRSFERVYPWLPLAGMPCHALITTLEDVLHVSWPVMEVKKLGRAASLELVEKLTGGDLPKEVVDKIVKEADGLPVQLVPSATTMANAKRRGRLKATTPLALEAETKGSFGGAYGRLERAAKILLHAATTLTPERISAAELTLPLSEGLAWSETEVERTLEVCLDLHLLEGVLPDLSMHQLFARFLREMELGEAEKAELAKVREAQAKRFVELAKETDENPADAPRVAVLLSYPLAPEAWGRLGQQLLSGKEYTVAGALYEVGRFDDARPWYERAVAKARLPDAEGRIDHPALAVRLNDLGTSLAITDRHSEARPWFERAVAEHEKGDAKGRVDYSDLGGSLICVGNCLLAAGEFENARPWYERAAEEVEKGDVQGRIDYARLSKSLHGAGLCLSGLEKNAEALPWFERAAAVAKKGDVQGRVDRTELGKSLYQVGYCLLSEEKYAEAQSWFELAVAEAEKGDVHGRIDHASLGGSLHQVGYCLFMLERYGEARPWFQRAVAEHEKGNVHGRINHENLARSLDEVGNCLMRAGSEAEAQGWFERAKEERAKAAA